MRDILKVLKEAPTGVPGLDYAIVCAARKEIERLRRMVKR